jgi:hypothetical protein
MIHASLLLLAAATSFPPAPALPAPLPPDVVTAWRNAGAEVGWIAIDALGRREWRFELDEPSDAAFPAFRFQVMPTKELAALPVPSVPFGVWNDSGHVRAAQSQRWCGSL